MNDDRARQDAQYMAAQAGLQRQAALNAAKQAADRAAAERTAAEATAQQAIQAAQAQAAQSLEAATAAIATLQSQPPPAASPEAIKAETVAARVAETAKNNKLDAVQGLSEVETERLFRLFGARSAFRGASRSPLA